MWVCYNCGVRYTRKPSARDLNSIAPCRSPGGRIAHNFIFYAPESLSASEPSFWGRFFAIEDYRMVHLHCILYVSAFSYNIPCLFNFTVFFNLFLLFVIFSNRTAQQWLRTERLQFNSGFITQVRKDRTD